MVNAVVNIIGIIVASALVSFVAGMGFSGYLHEKYNIRYFKGINSHSKNKVDKNCEGGMYGLK